MTGAENTDVTPSNQIDPEIIQSLVFEQDVAKLGPDQLLAYVKRLCDTLKIDIMMQPFQLLTLQKKKQLYATKNATDQLRQVQGISITDLKIEITNGICTATAKAEMRLKNGTLRVDMDMGIVPVQGLTGENLSNAVMKATTKAKRRVTLSLTGLLMMDETEVVTDDGAQMSEIDPKTGEISGPVFEAEAVTKESPAPTKTAQPEPGVTNPVTEQTQTDEEEKSDKEKEEIFPDDKGLKDGETTEDGKLIMTKDGLAFTFGKVDGKLLSKVARDPEDKTYLDWILKADFEDDFKSIVRDEMKMAEAESA